ncbi:guanylyl cyclase-activating protein 1-like [Pitangus sulphuratus]|nr:guanylyl cyclase-activating protein 1-like [Pitangus sulphuratus]
MLCLSRAENEFLTSFQEKPDTQEAVCKWKLGKQEAIRAINGGDHETSAEDFTNRVFDRIDVNGDGELSLEEFVEGARKDEEFMQVMMKSLDLSHIVAMINNRRHSI